MQPSVALHFQFSLNWALGSMQTQQVLGGKVCGQLFIVITNTCSDLLKKAFVWLMVLEVPFNERLAPFLGLSGCYFIQAACGWEKLSSWPHSKQERGGGQDNKIPMKYK
jgi:hypothetical protein